MKPYAECGICMLKWMYDRVTYSLEDEQRFLVQKKLMETVAKELEPSINLGILCNRSLKVVHEFLLESSRSYEILKRKSNEAAESLLELAKEFVMGNDTYRERLEKACALAAVSNVAPIGVPSAPFEFSQVEDIIRKRANLPEVVGDIYEAASRAQNVFYLADNAGEICFDSLVISILRDMGANVILVVKEGPFFDDVTMEDVNYFGLEQMVDAVYCVQGGFFVPEENTELSDIFWKSDLVISKGTGNFETLMGDYLEKQILFLLKSKCQPIAKETNIPEGDFIVRLEAQS